jgi:hypothetical protein
MSDANGRTERAEKLKSIFGEDIDPDDLGQPKVGFALMVRMLESLERHDALQERIAKAFETIAEQLGHVRVLFDARPRKPAARRRRRAKK